MHSGNSVLFVGKPAADSGNDLGYPTGAGDSPAQKWLVRALRCTTLFATPILQFATNSEETHTWLIMKDTKSSKGFEVKRLQASTNLLR